MEDYCTDTLLNIFVCYLRKLLSINLGLTPITSGIIGSPELNVFVCGTPNQNMF
jgi:hypothetical protein